MRLSFFIVLFVFGVLTGCGQGASAIVPSTGTANTPATANTAAPSATAPLSPTDAAPPANGARPSNDQLLLPTSTGGPASPDIGQAEATWRASGITSYRMAGSQTTFGPSFTYEITVKNNAITSATCTPAGGGDQPCPSFAPEGLTVDGLFERARSAAADPQRTVTLATDPTYGYPTVLSIDRPNAVDDDITWNVTSLEVLK